MMYKSQIEAASRAVIEDLQFRLFQKQLRYVYDHSPMYKRKYDEVNLKPEDIKTRDDIEKVPFTVKEDLRRSQEENPPFGDFLCVPSEQGVRCFETSGTSGAPVKVLFTPKDWFSTGCEHIAYQAYGMGIEKSDIVLFLFNYGLFIAWWGWQAGLESLGCLIIPTGGHNTKERVRRIIDTGATVVCGTPTYLIYVSEVANSMGVDLAAQTRVRIVVAAGEPGAQIPSTKSFIEKAWGAKCYDGLGAAEMPVSFGFECVAQQGTHLIESMFLSEVVNPETNERVKASEPGELIMTNLFMETMPLIRYRMRDYVKLNYNRCDCGRTFVRAEGGVIGRVDDMFTFAGVNIFPSAIEDLIRNVNQFSSEFRIIVPKAGTGKRLKIQVEPLSEAISKDELKKASVGLVETVKWNLGITPEVDVLAIGTLPRSELKARRVIREAN